MPPVAEDRSESQDPRAPRRGPAPGVRRMWAAAAAVTALAAAAPALGWLPPAAALTAAVAATAVAAVSSAQLRRIERWIGEEIERRRRSEHAAQAADRAKTDFLAKVSHELRTPLNAIVGTADLLLAGERSAENRRRLEVVDTSAETLLALVDDLLDFTAAESGRLRLDEVDFDLRQVVAQVETMIAPRAEEKQLELAVEVDPEVADGRRGDPVRLRQILFNLLHNAVKFTSAGSVTMRVEERPDGVRFTVRDTGIGISTKDQERIFETFAQADSSSARRFGGTGLGLAIARQLVELMGGTLGVDSVRGQGSTFRVELPLAAASAVTVAREPAPDRPKAEPGAFRVLVVDDETTNRLLALSHLQALGLGAAAAGGGEEALELLAAERFDAVLMDCAMPGLDGYETTRRLRRAEAESGRRRAVVIAVTAHAQAGERERCLAVGMDDYLAKPFRGRQLAAVLKRRLPVALTAPTRAPAQPPAAAGKPALDPAVLDRLRRLGRQAGTDVVGELADSYRRDSRALLATLARALDAADTAQLGHAVHSLVGISTAVGAAELVALCRAFEALLRAGDVEACRQAAASIVAEHRRVVAELTAAAAQPTAP